MRVLLSLLGTGLLVVRLALAVLDFPLSSVIACMSGLLVVRLAWAVLAASLHACMRRGLTLRSEIARISGLLEVRLARAVLAVSLHTCMRSVLNLCRALLPPLERRCARSKRRELTLSPLGRRLVRLLRLLVAARSVLVRVALSP